MPAINFKEYIREVPDFPKMGINFYDIAPLLGDGAIFASLVKEMAAPLDGKATKLVSFDARGFLFGAALAYELGIGNVMLRKPGKLPGGVDQLSYELEYGTNTLELQNGMLAPGDQVALVDDVVASGGTALAGIELVKRSGANIIEFCTVIDLPDLGGSTKLNDEGVDVRAMVSYSEVRND